MLVRFTEVCRAENCHVQTGFRVTSEMRLAADGPAAKKEKWHERLQRGAKPPSNRPNRPAYRVRLGNDRGLQRGVCEQ